MKPAAVDSGEGVEGLLAEFIIDWESLLWLKRDGGHFLESILYLQLGLLLALGEQRRKGTVYGPSFRIGALRQERFLEPILAPVWQRPTRVPKGPILIRQQL